MSKQAAIIIGNQLEENCKENSGGMKEHKVNLFVPQWQGSGLMKELYEGALALKQYSQSLKRLEFIDITVSDSVELFLENNIFGYSAVLDQLKRIKALLQFVWVESLLRNVFNLLTGKQINIEKQGLKQAYFLYG